MKLYFTRSRQIGSLAIRAATWSPWSHVAIEVGENQIIDSTMRHGGVRVRHLNQLLSECDEFAVVEVAVPNERAARRFLVRQVGKRYDYTGLLGIALRRRWAQDDRWFCNELAEAAMRAGGLQRFVEDLWRLTPRHSWIINHGVVSRRISPRDERRSIS